ncbi:MAG: CRISPR-associated endoribonuclease Cas6 [Mariniphaga sp.]|nr:CRISPR-associated endoribonuclease Cas6 [Mariniphaga sp.]
MRFKLNLSLSNRNQNVLPVNYQYELSAWIYKVINQSDPDFAAWLHDKGFSDDKKQFRLFTFSNLNIRHREILGDRLIVKSDPVELIISTLPEETIQHFVSGVFRDREFTLGDRISGAGFKIDSIEALPTPVFSDEMTFRSLSPVFVSSKIEGRKYAKYLSPTEDGYIQLVINNLKEKQRIFTGQESLFNTNDARMELLSPPKQKGITIKVGTPQETKLVGYHFNFKIKADATLLRMGYYCGFGEKGSQGFGCCENL